MLLFSSITFVFVLNASEEICKKKEKKDIHNDDDNNKKETVYNKNKERVFVKRFEVLKRTFKRLKKHPLLIFVVYSFLFIVIVVVVI